MRGMLILGLAGLAAIATADITNGNFEQGLKGWKAEGNAFSSQPTFQDNTSVRRPGLPVNHDGNYWIGTFEKRPNDKAAVGTTQGDEATGTLLSDRFKIEKSIIRFRVGGGADPEKVRVELLVAPDEGPNIPKNLNLNSILGAANKKKPGPEACAIVRIAAAAGDDSMGFVDWDVAEFKGKDAFIRIIDAGTGEMDHINVDAFEQVGEATPRAAIPALSPEALAEHERYMGMLAPEAKTAIQEAAVELANAAMAGLTQEQIPAKALELGKAKFPQVTDAEGQNAVAMLIMGEASKVSGQQLQTATTNIETANQTKLSLKEALKRAASATAGQVVSGLIANATNFFCNGGFSLKNLAVPGFADLKNAFMGNLSAQYPGVPNLASLPSDWQSLSGEALRALAPQLGGNAQLITAFVDYTSLRRQMGVSRTQALLQVCQPLINAQVGKLDNLIRAIKVGM